MITLERCFWTVVLEKTLESPLDNKEVQPVHPKGNQSWIFIRRTDDEAETPILWPPDVKIWLCGKDLDAGKDWRWEEKGTTADEIVGWHHQFNGMSLSKLRELVIDRDAWSTTAHEVAKSWTRVSDRTELNWTVLMAENKEELKSLLMKVKKESEIVGLKLNIPKVISWHLVLSLHVKLMAENWEQWQILFSWATKSL